MHPCESHYAYDTPYYDYSSGAPTYITLAIRSFSPVHPVDLVLIGFIAAPPPVDEC